MTKDVEEPIECAYFGCIYVIGHFWRLPHTWKKSMNPIGPWGQVDCKLTPRTTKEQSAAALHYLDGWTALAMHDYSVDDRGNSNSVFLINRILDFNEMIDSIKLYFPGILSRIESVAPIKLIEEVNNNDSRDSGLDNNQRIRPIYDNNPDCWNR